MDGKQDKRGMVDFDVLESSQLAKNHSKEKMGK
jgi:hypothetical protein